MKRTVTLVLLAAIMLITPMLNVAKAADVSTRTAELSAVKITDISKYDTPVPTGGKKITEKEYNTLMSKYPYKETTKGTSNFSYYLSISKRGEAGSNGKDKELESVRKVKSWYRIQQKSTDFYASYSENTVLMSKYSEPTNKVGCSLSYEDNTYSYYYSWYKNEKTGELWKDKKQPAASPQPTQKPPVREYMLYNDEKVLGETCKVYSIKENTDGENGAEYINYYWLSTVNGKIIKYLHIGNYEYGYYENSSIYFVDYYLNKPADFYNAPKTVKFTEPNY